MAVAVQVKTKVLPGHRIEIQTSELPVGSLVTVFVVLEEEALTKKPVFERLREHPGQKLFQSADEVDAYLKTERASWDN